MLGTTADEVIATDPEKTEEDAWRAGRDQYKVWVRVLRYIPYRAASAARPASSATSMSIGMAVLLSTLLYSVDISS